MVYDNSLLLLDLQNYPDVGGSSLQEASVLIGN